MKTARTSAALVFLLLPFLSELAIATEGGGTSKALGVDTVMAGVMPPPGKVQLTNFIAFYTSNHTLDGSGEDRPNLSNFDLKVWAEVLRFRYVLPDQVKFLGANIELRAGWNIVSNINVSFDAHTPFGIVKRDDSITAVGDSLLGVILGWHWKNFHQMFGPEFFLPTGKFDPTRLANTSRNYFSIGPSYWFTWFPIEQLEVSGALIYLFNLENPDTHYNSGNELSFDYNLGYFVTRDVQMGVSGYIYEQFGDDKLHGQVVGDGNRGQAVAVGPMIRWHPHDKPWGITFKWQHEEAVQNRASGNRFYLQAAFQF